MVSCNKHFLSSCVINRVIMFVLMAITSRAISNELYCKEHVSLQIQEGHISAFSGFYFLLIFSSKMKKKEIGQNEG